MMAGKVKTTSLRAPWWIMRRLESVIEVAF
jgi:hypothetical protein